MKRMLYRMVVPAAMALTLAACGGNDDYTDTPVATTPPVTTPPTTTPPTATAYDTFIAYVQRTVASMLDTAEPADVTAFDPAPVSDTREPVATQ